MRVYIGHIWGQQWGMGAATGYVYAHTWPYIGACMVIYGGIHGPHGSSNGACMRAYMAIYGGIHGPHGSSNRAAL